MGDLLQFPAHRMRQDQDHWFDKKELAAYLGRSERWIEMRMRDSGLPYDKDPHSRFVRFNPADVAHWQQTRRV